MSVFRTQSLLTIILETNYSNLASATETKIRYTKPNNKKGEWDAVVSGTTLRYDVQDGDIVIGGLWKFEAYAKFGGLKAFGDIAEQYFEEPIIP